MHEVKIIEKDVKNITLKVKPTSETILTVPLKTSKKHIAFILEKRKNWINEKKDFFKSIKKEPQKEYVSGESFSYLGKNYRLKVYEASKESVKLLRGYIQIFVKDKNDTAKKKKLLNAWYDKRAKLYFEKIVLSYQKIIKKEVKSLKIRQMKTRWGSCNHTKGYINLNANLIKKPKKSIEYVIFHELTHLIFPNHDKNFYNFLTTYMPDWKKRKIELELKP